MLLLTTEADVTYSGEGFRSFVALRTEAVGSRSRLRPGILSKFLRTTVLTEHFHWLLLCVIEGLVIL